MRVLIAIIAASLTLWVMYKLLFSSRDELAECFKYWLTPDIISLFRGRFWEDSWAEMKLFVWLGTAGLVGYGVYSL